MSKKKLKYELIDNDTGRTLLSGSSSLAVLTDAAQYIRDYGVSYYDVTYIVLRNGASSSIQARVTGAALQELVEDMEIVDEYGLIEDTSGDEFEDDWAA